MRNHLLTIFAVSILTACGGGGSSTPTVDTQTAACTTPSTTGAPVTVAGSAGTLDVASSTTKYALNVTGSTNTVRVPACAYITTLTISGGANTVTLDHTAQIEAVVINVNANSNTVHLPSGSAAGVTDLGSLNTITRNQ